MSTMPGCSYSGDQLLYMHVGPGSNPIGVLAYAALEALDYLVMMLSERQNGSCLRDHANPEAVEKRNRHEI